jgi:hypothetical protein
MRLGALGRVPRDFYAGVWELLHHCRGIVIGDKLEKRNRLESAPLLSEKTAGERNFASLVEHLLSKIEAPEYRQLCTETLITLIAFVGATRSTATRSRDEAEQLTGEIYAKVRNGEDFTKLMKQHTGDPGPGTYPMSKATRAGMVAGFGNVGWRLQVGEIGVAPYDTKDSPFGWHVIKRLK